MGEGPALAIHASRGAANPSTATTDARQRKRGRPVLPRARARIPFHRHSITTPVGEDPLLHTLNPPSPPRRRNSSFDAMGASSSAAGARHIKLHARKCRSWRPSWPRARLETRWRCTRKCWDRECVPPGRVRHVEGSISERNDTRRRRWRWDIAHVCGCERRFA